MTAPDTPPMLLAQGGAPHGHGGGRTQAPPLPRFVNFETGANVKALALIGRNLWLGMPNGLIRYNVDSYDDHEIFTVESTRTTGPDGKLVPGLLSNGVYGLDVAPDGTLWISTYGGGLTHYDGRTWQTFTPKEGLGDRWAYDVEFERDGTMWVATWKGASRFDGKRFTTFTEADGLVDKWVYDIEIAPDGKIWMGTEGGVSVYDGKKFVATYTHKDGLGAEIPEAERKPVLRTDSRHHRTQGKANQGYNPNYVLALAFTGNGKNSVAGKSIAWIGTWGAGLSRFDGKAWRTFTTRDGLGGNFIHALAVAPDGTLWAATDGGVSYLKGERWTTINKDHGLLDDNVFSMLFEQDGSRWFGTWQGLSRMATPPRTAPPGSPQG